MFPWLFWPIVIRNIDVWVLKNELLRFKIFVFFRSEAYSFDSTALERAAKAAKVTYCWQSIEVFCKNWYRDDTGIYIGGDAWHFRDTKQALSIKKPLDKWVPTS